MNSPEQLFIDIGNSRIKSCFRISGVLHQSQFWQEERLPELAKQISDNTVVVICSVSRSGLERVLQQLRPRFYKVVDHHLLDRYISYDTPQTLGMDRVVAALGAWHTFGTGGIVIDAGTATTIDLITRSGVFSGGVIMPGIAIMGQALNSHTELPGVERKLPEYWPPTSTTSALQWGITGSYLAAVQSHIDRFQSTYEELEIVITGGDAEWLQYHLTGAMRRVDNLIFRGMSYVADYVIA